MFDSVIEGFGNTYRNIFIVDSYSLWELNNNKYNSSLDLVLTLDFALYNYIKQSNGNVFFLDHLINNEIMQRNNYIVYDFFKKWHYDKDNKDLFVYKNISFGFSLRLEIWNDYIFYVRLYLCLSVLKTISFDKLYLSTNNDTILDILDILTLDYVRMSNIKVSSTDFYFPIEKWMDEKIRPTGLRSFLYKTREVVSSLYGFIMPIFDKAFSNDNKKTIYIQEYHPTKEILKLLREDSTLKILLSNFSRGSNKIKNLKERLVPISGNIINYEKTSSLIMDNFILNKTHKLILGNSDITSIVYNIIEKRISKSLPNILRTLDSSISYLSKNKVDLEILIANIGHAATLFDCVCKSKGIPSYLIINGLLGPEYQDDSKYATMINSYSESIKKFYFKGMDNIVVLGDPRMDIYANMKKNEINRNNPTITIGASGFNSVDLNSYVAVEFDFMYDILSTFENIINNSNIKIDLNIKVRGNGYKKQYIDFCNNFFPSLNIKIEDTISMKNILLKTDFYISIYSQTLFEASCLGIPVVYYRKDNELMDPPFDNKSELVTVSTPQDLNIAFNDFITKNERYNDFLDKKIMEKYVGPLDGNNLKRNIDYIYKLLDEKEVND